MCIRDRADAVMVGAATLRNPSATMIILDELERYANDMKIEKISELTGTLSI